MALATLSHPLASSLSVDAAEGAGGSAERPRAAERAVHVGRGGERAQELAPRGRVPIPPDPREIWQRQRRIDPCLEQRTHVSSPRFPPPTYDFMVH